MRAPNRAQMNGQDGRSRSDLGDRRDPGPYIATVVSHLDTKFMGSLKVRLDRTMTAGNNPTDDQNLLTAFYASPFYGVTSFRALGANDDYRETQQSYGFWAVPPDVGTRVLVTFVEGRADICFWFACVPDDYMNFMVPDGRAATTLVTPGSGTNQVGKKLPVGEYNKRITATNGNTSPTTYQKPVNNDFVDRLTEAGLLEDDTRGLTTSSARREVPSAVFGINTPGPLDKRAGAKGLVAGTDDHNMQIFSQRLGGHSIVMDDGDANILRRGHPSETPAEYVDIENTDEPVSEEMRTLPANELFRIRTRTGHQILLHNTEDLIYISNSRGTAWIELTSNGKIDIYAQDSISMHTEGEFNVTADSNINLTSGGNINLNATKSIKSTAGNSIDNTAGTYIASNASDDFSVTAGDFIAMRASSDFSATATSGTLNLTGATGIELDSYASVNILAQSGSVRMAGTDSIQITGGDTIELASPEIHNKSEQYFVDTSVANIIAGNNVYLTGGAGIDLYTAAFKLEAFGSIDMQTKGQMIASADGTLKLKTSGTFEVGSTNVSVDSSTLQFSGNIATPLSIKAGSIAAPSAELNFIRSNTGSGGASASTPSYSLHDPGIAAPATIAVFAENPSPPEATVGPDPTTAAPAAVAPRVPQHEPWFQHENFNPASYSNIRAGDESTDSYVTPTPDPFSFFRSSTIPASSQSSTAGRNDSVSGDGETEETTATDRNGNTVNLNTFTDPAKEAMQFFINKGYKEWQAAGIVGAMVKESGNLLEPGAWLAPDARRSNGVVVGGGNLGARGIVQWREAGGRLTLVERYLGKPILSQPETNVNAENYTRLRTERLPTQSFSSLPWSAGGGVKVAPSIATLVEQLDAVEWEMNNGTIKYAIKSQGRINLSDYVKTVDTGNANADARAVARAFESSFLRSGGALIPEREASAVSLYQAWARGYSTNPITDPNTSNGTAPITASVPGDPVDDSSSNVPHVVERGIIAVRLNLLNRALISAINKAARDAGITRIEYFSAANEPVRQIDLTREIPLSDWGTRLPRTDMRYENGKWQKLINSEWTTRPNGASWRVGTERHDTGLAADIRLFVDRNGTEELIVNTSNYGRGKIAAFCAAFVKHGGRGIGHATEYMQISGIHVDMLGQIISDSSRYREVPGFELDPTVSNSEIVGWNPTILSIWHWSNSNAISEDEKIELRREYAWLVNPVCAEWNRLVRG